jgi:hypothetical protein
MKNYYIVILSLLFVVNVQAQCVANYTFIKDSTTVHFSDSSDADGNFICSYSWDFGDNNTSMEQNPTHTYDSAGTYTVCLEIVTASDSSCSDTVCIDSVCKDITVENNCHLQITYISTNASATGVCDGSIDLSVENGTQPYQYEWSTGEGQEDLQNLCAGTYSVTVIDDESCEDSLSIEILEPDTLIRGKVYVKSNLLPEGMILLINSENKVIDKSPIESGDFNFYTLPDTDNYTLYAIPYFDVEEEYYPQYFPTYTGDVLHWQLTTTITKDSNQFINIHLKCYDELIHGQGFLSGNVYYDDNASFEENIYLQDWFGNFSGVCQEHLAANVTVLLMDKNKEVLKSCLTDNKGYYQFTHLPLQDYLLYVEKNAKQTLTKSIRLSNENDTVNNFNFTIKGSIVTDIKNINSQKEFVQLMPNPFSDYLIIKNKSKVDIQKIEIRDLQARLVYLQEKECSIFKINTQKWSKGIYFLRLWTKDSYVSSKKIIKY